MMTEMMMEMLLLPSTKDNQSITIGETLDWHDIDTKTVNKLLQ